MAGLRQWANETHYKIHYEGVLALPLHDLLQLLAPIRPIPFEAGAQMRGMGALRLVTMTEDRDLSIHDLIHIFGLNLNRFLVYGEP